MIQSYINEFGTLEGMEKFISDKGYMYQTILNNCCDVYELCQIENDFNIFEESTKEIYLSLSTD